MSELHPISDICKDPARRDTRRADVVFVHGLGGNHVLTWRDGDRKDGFWPEQLAADFPDVGVWTLSYAASPSAWFRWLKRLPLQWVPGLGGFYRHADRDTGHSMHLPDRGVEVLNGLVLADLGKRPLIFVCHSLGGLLAKQVLRSASDDGRPGWKAVRENTAAVIFLSTPHEGSRLATAINRAGKVLRANPSLYGLKANDPYLRNLGNWYVNNMSGAENVVYFETRDTLGLRVVDEDSARLGMGHTPVPQDEDHLSISKPRKPDADVCKDLRRLVSAVIGRDTGGTTGANSGAGIPMVQSGHAPASPVELHVHIPQSVSAQPPAIPCILPYAASRFFGRDDAVETLIQRLHTQRNTVVAGAAGLGKTALAAEALRQALGDRPWERLHETPFPDGIVNVDLYTDKDQPRMCWKRIADAVAGIEYLKDQPEDVRAKEACRGRRLLLIVEGGEEADGGPRPDGGQRPSRRSLLDPLGWEGAVLWLTRPTSTSPTPDIALNEPLGEQDASDLLAHLTVGAPMSLNDADRQALLDAMDGHPLALTWAGGLLQRGGLRPAELVAEFRQQPARNLHDPEDARHTLHWLFQRSVRLLDASARETLATAGLLAHAPFPAEAVCAATGLDADRQRQVLRQCAQSRLLMPVDDADLPDHWRFGHALGYQFARALGDEGDPAPREAMLDRLMAWADARLQAELATSAPALALVHTEALLQMARPPDGWILLVNRLLYDHGDRLEALGRLGDRLVALRLVESWWRRLPEDLGREAEWQREASTIDELSGNVLLEQGDLAGAQRRYEAGLRIREVLAARDSENTGRQHDLSVIFGKLGYVLELRGNLVGAQRHYETSQQIIEGLIRHDPDNADWQRDLGVTFEKLGDLLQVQGDLPGAQGHYEAGLSISEALVARDPENTGWQRDLSVSIEKLGDVVRVQGDLVGAQRHYERSLRIIEGLVPHDPENAGWQRHLSVSHNKLGDVLQALGDPVGAKRRYEAGLQIREALVARDPENAGWQRDLSVSFEKLGSLLQAQSDLAAAQRRYEAGLQISEALAARDPENAGWQRDLSVTLEKMGDVLLAQGDPVCAKRRYEVGLRIRETLVARDPENAGWQRDLSLSFDRLGDVLQLQRDLAGAQRHYEAGLRIREALAARDPENADWQRDLMVSLFKLGQLCSDQSDAVVANAHWIEARRILLMLVERWPEHPQFQRDLAVIEKAIASLNK